MAWDNANNAIMKDLRGYMKLSEIKRIIDATKEPEYKLLYLILSRTGRRITEVIGRKAYIATNNNAKPDKNGNIIKKKQYPAIDGIKPEDIDFDEGTIVFPIIKKKRLVRAVKTISKPILFSLAEYINENEIKKDEPIFKMNRWDVNRHLKKTCYSIDIKYIGSQKPHVHHFRHSFAIHVLRNSPGNTGIKQIQSALEHSSINITSGYLQFDNKELNNVLEKTFNEEYITDKK